MPGPLAGVKVLEFEAIGPGPFAGMLLADMGADVLLVDRPAASDLGLKRERWMDVMLRCRMKTLPHERDTVRRELNRGLALELQKRGLKTA